MSSQSLSLVFLSVTPFCFQNFGSFSLSFFGILHQVDSLSLPLLFGLLGIYPVPLPAEYPLSLHLVYIAVFGVAFLYSGSLWISLYCGGFLLWMGLDGWIVKGFLVREACVSVLVDGAGFLLSGCNEVSSDEL